MDMLFRLSGGVYHQPPFYRELRDSTGTVRPEVKAQQSIHIVLGNDYSFDLWERPFTLNSEVYYKHLTDVNPYTLKMYVFDIGPETMPLPMPMGSTLDWLVNLYRAQRAG